VRGSDRAILLVIPLVAALIAVWILVISPKRADESDLADQAAALQSEADQAQSQADQAELARKQFNRNYAALVDLGAAAPADDDQSTLVYTLADIANGNDLRFSGFTLSASPAGVDSTSTTTTTPTTPAPTTSETGTTTTPTDTSASSTATTTTPSAGTTSSTTTSTTTTTAPPTEAAAATLPLGAAVGPAGFPVSSYAFSLQGKYFNAADFLRDVDSQVEAREGKGPKVHGRLLTVDGFAFALDQLEDFPQITANLTVTAYEVPPEQGVEAGATAAGPAPVGTTTTGSATGTTSTTTPATASVTP
jgi:hypothetical protein